MTDFFALLSTPFWSGVATALTIISLAVTLLKLARGRAERIFYEIIDSPILTKPDVNGVVVNVAAGKSTGQSLHRRTIFIFNATKKSFDEQDFVGTPFEFKKSERVVYSIRSVEVASSAKFDVEENSASIRLKNILLPSQSAIILDIFHDESINGPLVSHPRNSDVLKRYNISGNRVDWKLVPFVILSPFILPALYYLTISFFKERLTYDFPLVSEVLLAFLNGGLIVTMMVLSVNYSIDKVLALSRGKYFRSPAEVEFLRFLDEPASTVITKSQMQTD